MSAPGQGYGHGHDQPAVDVLASPGHDRRPSRVLAFVRRSPRLLISVALLALLVAGLVQTVRNGGPEEQLARAYANSFEAGDCVRFADLYHYDPPVRSQRRDKIAICERGGPDMELGKLRGRPP